MVSATVALVEPASVARVAAHRGGSRRVAARLGASAPTRSRRVAVPRAASTDTETASRADASASDEFDDALAEQFKQMYATPGKRIKWGVFKEDVGAVATSPKNRRRSATRRRPRSPTSTRTSANAAPSSVRSPARSASPSPSRKSPPVRPRRPRRHGAPPVLRARIHGIRRDGFVKHRASRRLGRRRHRSARDRR